jgi:hypothetical protein
MTRKDYQNMADALAKAATDNAGNGGPMTVQDDISFVSGVEQAAIRIAEMLAKDNVRFSEGMFFRAFDQAVQIRKNWRRSKDGVA